MVVLAPIGPYLRDGSSAILDDFIFGSLDGTLEVCEMKTYINQMNILLEIETNRLV